MNTCSGLSALDHANSKYTKGYATSGIVCTTCRHEFILPEGAGPLQKGERFVFAPTSSTPIADPQTVTLTLTTWLPGVPPTTPKRTRWHRTI